MVSSQHAIKADVLFDLCGFHDSDYYNISIILLPCGVSHTPHTYIIHVQMSKIQ